MARARRMPGERRHTHVGVSPAAMPPWRVVGVIAVGGGVGSVARYGLAQAWPTTPGGFPWATFVTNAAGCLALGLVMVLALEVWPRSRYLRPFLGVGVLGGFTTFSTYTVEIRTLLAGRHFALASSYALASLVAGMAMTWVGIVVARSAGHLPVRRGPRLGEVRAVVSAGGGPNASRALEPVEITPRVEETS